jgi:bifunctional UDP-N-acetylglucosamine pyrophosphorylase/glucosamine-1-phosphate N-acetyltransferase
MLSYVLTTAWRLSPERLILVVGHGRDEVKKAVSTKVEIAVQAVPRGTADAVKSARERLKDFQGSVLIMYGDVPLIHHETLRQLIELYRKKKAKAAFLTAHFENPTGYGRVLRDKAGKLLKIVEEKDALPQQKLIKEVNTGFYLFDKQVLDRFLDKVGNENAAEEYYLTDLIEQLVNSAETVATLEAPDSREVLGVNSRSELAQVERLMRERINSYWLEKGVTMIEPQLTFVGPRVKLSPDTVVYPMTFLYGETEIGEGCRLGPSTTLVNVKVGANSRLSYTVGEDCMVGEKVTVGPFARLRGGSKIMAEARVGTFVEIKNSEVGKKSKVPHLSYIGDAIIGQVVNVGAGTITCNFDGFEKHPTFIEDEAFIGSDTMLVAPVKIGRGAVIGAGSTITKDVPPDALAVERSEQQTVEGWAKKRKSKGGRKVGRKANPHS